MLTLLPGDDGPAFLLGDLAAGAGLLAKIPDDELAAFAGAYDLGERGETLRGTLIAAQAAGPAAGLQQFLQQIHTHLRSQRRTIHRLPLILVPDDLVAGDGTVAVPFLVGWNNVVLEIDDGRRHAEGFMSGLPTGDARARTAFAELGYDLRLLPPLIDSVTRGGGYRCASQHLRRAIGSPENAEAD